MINKKDTLGQIMQNYPEVAPVLAKAGLHCVGCHVSAYESLEDGCLAHGLKEKDILDIIKKSNDVIKKVDSLPEISFTKKALEVLEIPKEELQYYYSDINQFRENCKFSDCLHWQEPEDKCAVKKAIKEGSLSKKRYESYLRILKEL